MNKTSENYEQETTDKVLDRKNGAALQKVQLLDRSTSNYSAFR